MASETKSTTALETFAQEDRRFPTPADFAATANAGDPGIYQRAERDLEGFWAEQAKELFWRKPFDKVLEWEAPYAKWFLGGELNLSENCLDRHVKAGRGTKVAYHWDGEPGDTRTMPSRRRRRSRRCSSCDVRNRTCRGRSAATSGGTTSSTSRSPSARRNRSTASTCCISSTPPEPPRSQRASSIRRPAISPAW